MSFASLGWCSFLTVCFCILQFADCVDSGLTVARIMHPSNVEFERRTSDQRQMPSDYWILRTVALF